MIARRELMVSASAALLAAVLPRRAVAADDPAGILTAIYTRVARGKGDSGGTFVIEKAARTKYLSNALVALWAKADARTRKGDSGPVDFDPVTNSQDPDVKSFKVAAAKQEADKATLAVTIESHQQQAHAKEADKTVRYDFVREAGQWKIDDIKGAVDGSPWSVRALLAASLR